MSRFLADDGGNSYNRSSNNISPPHDATDDCCALPAPKTGEDLWVPADSLSKKHEAIVSDAFQDGESHDAG